MTMLGIAAKAGARLAGSAVGGPVGIAITAASFLPLLMDLAKGGSDPAKIEAVKKMRDESAERVMAEKGISRDAAMQIVNEQMKPLIEQAQQSGASGGEMLADAATAGAGLLARKRGGGAMPRPTAKPEEDFNYHAPDTGPIPTPSQIDPALIEQLVAAKMQPQYAPSENAGLMGPKRMKRG